MGASHSGGAQILPPAARRGVVAFPEVDLHDGTSGPTTIPFSP